nr:MAG TPA: hypothetical protein [Caudoviricetes sp.]DAR48929.1 MAG TPA: hypothetical protein [Caudoviricetes sp.]DAY80686.1 MAG TPA: hypothetical protein [Caudoviricetes sp.]
MPWTPPGRASPARAAETIRRKAKTPKTNRHQAAVRLILNFEKEILNMKTVEEVLQKYTLGEAGKDETNDGLKELGSPLRLNPDRNVITPEELAETRVGETPAEANGWGILDHGVGSLEKVHVVNGRTVDVDMGHEAAYVYIAGRKYRLRSDVLTEED